jgi:hypothetical protein
MNIVIAKKDDDKIIYFIKNCFRKGRDYIGNKKVLGIKPHLFDIKCTTDITNPILNSEGKQIGWDKKFSEMPTADEPGPEIDKTNELEMPAIYTKIIDIAKMSFDQIDTHVDTTFSQLNLSQRNSLKFLYKTVLGLVKLELRESNLK